MSNPNKTAQNGRLFGLSVYLAGPMDDPRAEGGLKWRDEATPYFEEMGVEVKDPAHKQTEFGKEDAEVRIETNRLKEAGQFDEVRERMKIIRFADLKLVDKADFLLVYLDLDMVMCGTWEEIFWANRLKRPIVVFSKQPIKELPNWIFGTIPHEMFFEQMDEALYCLIQIHSHEPLKSLAEEKRWHFLPKIDESYCTTLPDKCWRLQWKVSWRHHELEKKRRTL